MLQEQSLWHDKDPSQLKDRKHPTKTQILQPSTGNDDVCSRMNYVDQTIYNHLSNNIVRGEFCIIINVQ